MAFPTFTYFRIFLLLIPVILLNLSGCSDKPADTRLARVEKLVSYSPGEALDSLRVINYEDLSATDKQYYDFLLIKTRDKAFITHTSDSLILKVIANERRHTDKARYNEALYYGGRVYHDLGDLPTALNYYQQALDNLKDDKTRITLKGCILSQMAGLLNSLRLYEQAVPYIEEVILLDSIANDSTNLMYDLELSGSINLHAKKYDSAELRFNKAKSLAKLLCLADTTRHNMYLAAIKYNQGELPVALNLIRSTVPDIDSISRNVALAYACNIYRKSNIPDTAFLYALELIHSLKLLNRKTGYQTILSDELRGYRPSDSTLQYVYEYRDLIESYLNQNGDQAALIQNDFYNYQLHEKERIKTEGYNRRLNNWIVGILIVMLCLCLCLLYLKNRNKSQLLQLHEAINNVALLRQALKESEENKNDSLSNKEPIPIESEALPDEMSQNIHNLRHRLREDLLSLCSTGNQSYSISPTILESEVYEKIRVYIEKERVIPENNAIWRELEEVVLKTSPEFKYRLHLLTGGKLKLSDFHLALLIKCGISSTNISILVGRAKSTIAYRKDALSFKVFDQKLGTGVIENIIHLL